jgi:hypothetical protein
LKQVAEANDLQDEAVDGEEQRPNQLLLRQKAVDDHDGPATLFEDRLDFGLGQLAAESGLAFLDLVESPPCCSLDIRQEKASFSC